MESSTWSALSFQFSLDVSSSSDSFPSWLHHCLFWPFLYASSTHCFYISCPVVIGFLETCHHGHFRITFRVCSSPCAPLTQDDYLSSFSFSSPLFQSPFFISVLKSLSLKTFELFPKPTTSLWTFPPGMLHHRPRPKIRVVFLIPKMTPPADFPVSFGHTTFLPVTEEHSCLRSRHCFPPWFYCLFITISCSHPSFISASFWFSCLHTLLHWSLCAKDVRVTFLNDIFLSKKNNKYIFWIPRFFQWLTRMNPSLTFTGGPFYTLFLGTSWVSVLSSSWACLSSILHPMHNGFVPSSWIFTSSSLPHPSPSPVLLSVYSVHSGSSSEVPSLITPAAKSYPLLK